MFQVVLAASGTLKLPRVRHGPAGEINDENIGHLVHDSLLPVYAAMRFLHGEDALDRVREDALLIRCVS